MRFQGSRGSITLEMVLVVPALFLLILAGGLLAHMASAKASLQMATTRAARELAASEAARRLEKSGQAYVYREFTETYGLPRAHVQMVVGKLDDQFIVAGACYRSAVPLPLLGEKPPSEWQQRLQAVTDFLPDSRTLTALEQTVGKAEEVYNQGTDDWKGIMLLWSKLSALTADPEAAPEFSKVGNGGTFSDMAGFDEVVEAQCGGKLDFIVSAHAAFWSEESYHPPSPPEVQLELEPPEVILPADTNPDTLPTVVATATTTPPDATCSIKVVYKSGESTAKFAESRTQTADGVKYQWTWHVGSNTGAQNAPVTVSCNGGQSATKSLTVRRAP